MGLRQPDKKLLRALSPETRWAIRAAFKLWVQTAREEGYEPIKMWGNFENEVDHSALLNRLLLGNDPLEQAPPKAFSYPWYELHETEYAENCEVWVPQGEYWKSDDIVINQSHWKIVEKISDEEYIVRWKDGYPNYRAWRSRPAPGQNATAFGWSLEKLDEPEPTE
jgi:hypothetical protein